MVKNLPANAGDIGSSPGSGSSPGEGIDYPFQYSWASLVAQLVKNAPAMWETWVWSLGWENPLEEGMATHSSILAWRIPWTGETGGLYSMEYQGVRHDWGTKPKPMSFSDRISLVHPFYHPFCLPPQTLLWINTDTHGGSRSALMCPMGSAVGQLSKHLCVSGRQEGPHGSQRNAKGKGRVEFCGLGRFIAPVQVICTPGNVTPGGSRSPWDVGEEISKEPGVTRVVQVFMKQEMMGKAAVEGWEGVPST